MSNRLQDQSNAGGSIGAWFGLLAIVVSSVAFLGISYVWRPFDNSTSLSLSPQPVQRKQPLQVALGAESNPPARPHTRHSPLSTSELARRATNASLHQSLFDNVENGKYALQVGSFREKARAASYVSALAQQGYRARLLAVELPALGTRYRVRTGSFANQTQAEQASRRFRRQVGQDAIVVSAR